MEIFKLNFKFQSDLDPEEGEQQVSHRKYDSIVPARAIKRSVQMTISYLEIYNECVNDLLNQDNKNLNVKATDN